MSEKKQKSQEREQKKKEKTFSLQKVQNIFIFNGITALIGWNALLGAFDYFGMIYKSYNVSLYFPIPVFLGYTVTAMLFRLLTLNFSYKILIPVGIMFSNFTMILFLAISQLSKENQSIGFLLSLINGFFLGFFSNVVQLSFFGMINYFGGKTVSRFTVGTALSGLSVILLRAIVTAIFGSQHPTDVVPIIIYLLIAALFNIFDMCLNLSMFKTSQYLQKIQKPFQQQKKIIQNQSIQTNQKNNQFKKSYIVLLWESGKNTLPYPLLICFNFVITFMLFPNLTLLGKTGYSKTWSSIMFLIMYNIGDFAGKLICDYRWSFNAISTKYLFVGRLFFFFTIPILTKTVINDDYLLNNNIFPFINQFLFAFTNGIVINASFILAYQIAAKQYKKYAGILAGFLLQIGITIGTFLAIPFTTIVQPDYQ